MGRLLPRRAVDSHRAQGRPWFDATLRPRWTRARPAVTGLARSTTCNDRQRGAAFEHTAVGGHRRNGRDIGMDTDEWARPHRIAPDTSPVGAAGACPQP